MASFVALPWAIHISDGVLGWPMLAGGFAVAALLAGMAAWRIRENEIPRVALLTAAFFVASSIHVKLGPTSVHLLLGGLVGAVIGRRAPLAILIGVTLQALLIPHGGISTIGINTCVEAIPALLAGGVFGALSWWGDSAWLRSLLMGLAGLVWGACLLFGLAVLWTNSLAEVLHWSSDAGLVVSVEHLGPALAIMRHPLALAGLGVFALAAVLLERWRGSSPGFARGVLVGVLAVLATTALVGQVLLFDGAERWSTFVAVVFVAHLPLALLEGVIVGTIVGFLERVKPEMLATAGAKVGTIRLPAVAAEAVQPAPAQGVQTGSVQALLAFLAVLALAGPARAHGLETTYRVDTAARRITLTSFYETGDAPEKATARVLREDGSVLAEGSLDDKGRFVFSYDEIEPLHVHVRAPGGHKAFCLIPAGELKEPAPAGTARGSRGRDLLLGLGLLLAAAAFAMSWRNNLQLKRLAEMVERRA